MKAEAAKANKNHDKEDHVWYKLIEAEILHQAAHILHRETSNSQDDAK